MFHVRSASQKQWGRAEKRINKEGKNKEGKTRKNMLHTVYAGQFRALNYMSSEGQRLDAQFRALRKSQCTVSCVRSLRVVAVHASLLVLRDWAMKCHGTHVLDVHVRMVEWFFSSKPALKSRTRSTRKIRKNMVWRNAEIIYNTKLQTKRSKTNMDCVTLTHLF